MARRKIRPFERPADALLDGFAPPDRRLLEYSFSRRLSYVPHAQHPKMIAARLDLYVPPSYSTWAALNYLRRQWCTAVADAMASGFTEESLLGVLPPARASLELRNELVAENKGLPDVIYRRYRGRVDRDELWSVCHEGLIAAVEGFDEGRGYKFTTYACRAMKSRLSRHLLEQATSRRQPLQLLTEWDSESCGVDIAANRRETLLSLGLRELVPMLTRRPADVISRRFGLFGPEETLEAIAKSYGITRERVRQIQDAALLELREMWDRRAAVS